MAIALRSFLFLTIIAFSIWLLALSKVFSIKDDITDFSLETESPTIIIDSKGKVIDKVVGKIEKQKFLEMLNHLEPNK